jgi:glycosyltransferase involved in cell wall biosynthesis
MGKAVVSTSVGCEGLEAVDGKNILIRDDPAAFAAAVTTVLRDTGLRAALERNARLTAEQRYSWDVIGETMRRLYGEVLAKRSAATTAPR